MVGPFIFFILIQNRLLLVFLIFLKYNGQNSGRISKDTLTREHEKNLEFLNDASERIQELEEKLQTLESRIPKTYPEVKFLNYLNRRRILVNAY